jgi:hypothetical protein
LHKNSEELEERALNTRQRNTKKQKEKIKKQPKLEA